MSGERATDEEMVGTLVATWRQLSALGAELTEEQWKTSTDLPGWNVQDVFSHVIGTERLLAELPGAGPHVEEMPAYVRNPIGEFNEREVATRRSHSGAEVLAEWDQLRTDREATLVAADADYFAQRADTPTGPGTVADFLAVRIVDCWVHEQDVRRALGLSGTYSGDAAEHCVDRLTRGLPMVVGKRAACPEGGAVVVELTGPVRRRLVCEVRDGRAAFVDGPSATPLASIAMDTETFVLLATGRRTADELSDRITATGDRALADAVVARLNVMI